MSEPQDPKPDEGTPEPDEGGLIPNDNGGPTWATFTWQQSYGESQAAIPEAAPTP